MLSQLKPAILILLVFTALTGVVYPLAVTGIAQVAFPFQSNGSLIAVSADRGAPVGTAGMVGAVGSMLIGQPFDDPRYFWGRPSATAPFPDNAMASGGSNLGPTNPQLVDAVRARVEALHRVDPGNTLPIPADLVTASGSGLDPDISLAAAEYQAGRVAAARGFSLDRVLLLVHQMEIRRTLALLGEPRVNVLALNLALDRLR
jgi:potassium-transporting ATPase KdpC subunit